MPRWVIIVGSAGARSFLFFRTFLVFPFQFNRSWGVFLVLRLFEARGSTVSSDFPGPPVSRIASATPTAATTNVVLARARDQIAAKSARAVTWCQSSNKHSSTIMKSTAKSMKAIVSDQSHGMDFYCASSNDDPLVDLTTLDNVDIKPVPTSPEQVQKSNSRSTSFSLNHLLNQLLLRSPSS